jgi:peptidoglycan/LPS O-acetylase OafA/YrhL
LQTSTSGRGESRTDRARAPRAPIPVQRDGFTGWVLPHVDAFDGLRALAVAAVLVYHSGVALPGGFLGVSTFFTLSGFLIATLLLARFDDAGRRERRGTDILRGFWAQRFRRLLPAALLALVLATGAVCIAGDPGQLASFRGDALSALADVANWHFIAAGQSYAAVSASPSFVQHFWSLAIEEQFYLVLPLVLAAVMVAAHRSRRTFAIVVAVLAAISTALPHLFALSGDRVYYGTDTRAAELLVGALLAALVSARVRRRGSLHAAFGRRARLVLLVAGPLALAAVVVTWAVTDQGTAWLAGGGLTAYALASAVIIAAVLVPGSPFARAIGVGPLRALGRISYGVYLYHWPIFLVLSPARTGWAPPVALAIDATLTVGLALVSFHLVEQPVRIGTTPRWLDALGLGRAARTPRPERPGFAVLAPMAAMGVTLLIVAATVSTPTAPGSLLDAESGTLISDVHPGGVVEGVDQAAPLPEPDPSTPSTVSDSPGSVPTTAPQVGAALQAPSTTAATPTLPELAASSPLTPKPVRRPSRPLRILIVGDSTAVALDVAVDTWGRSTRTFGAANYARIGCGVTRGGARVHLTDQEPVPPACDGWATDWPSALRASGADVVVLASGFWDLTDRQMPGDSTWRTLGDPVYDAYFVSEYTKALDVLHSTGATVLVLDDAPLGIGRDQVPPVQFPVDDPARVTRANQLLAQVVDTRSFARLLPYDAFMSAWPAGPFDLRHDGLHINDPATGAKVMTWLGPEIVDAYWNVRWGIPGP